MKPGPAVLPGQAGPVPDAPRVSSNRTISPDSGTANGAHLPDRASSPCAPMPEGCTSPDTDVACKSWAAATLKNMPSDTGARDSKDGGPPKAPKAPAKVSVEEGALEAEASVAEASISSLADFSAKPLLRLLEVPGKASKADASPSTLSRTASDNSSIRDESVEEVYSRTPSPSRDPRQTGKGQLAELLEMWKSTRHEGGPLSIEECECMENVFYDTVNPDRVKIVEMRRVIQPALLRRFCAEEQDSLERQARSQKTHKQFMLLHGTRWEYAPLIAENGLDPSCGHLTKGSWLGGRADKAHSYASKGPGPEVDDEDGHKARLFALFVVACVPDVNDGDDERSFGVWRIQSARRMCPAYQVIYSAPADVGRHKRPLIEPRANKAMLLKQGHDGTGTESAGMSSFRYRSVSPPPRSRSPNPQEAEATCSCPLPGRMPGACTSPALKAGSHERVLRWGEVRHVA